MAWPSNSISLLFYPGEKKNQGVTCGIVPQHIRSGSWQVTETTSFGVALSFFPSAPSPECWVELGQHSTAQPNPAWQIQPGRCRRSSNFGAISVQARAAKSMEK